MIRETYEREILQSQIEIQNHTLKQIGQELHDHIGQLLSLAMLQLNILDDEMDGSQHHPALNEVQQVIGTIIQDVRTLSKSLDSDTIQRFGLCDSLTMELDRIQRMGRFQTQLTVQGTPYSLDPQVETVLFRMAQESLNNAIKHSAAKTLSVLIDYESQQFTLTIADDGRGFSVAETSQRVINESGSGLRNLQQRAILLGGVCEVDSQSGRGTKVHIRLPHK